MEKQVAARRTLTKKEREVVRERARQWNADNKERRKKNQKAYALKNADKLKEYQRRYQQELTKEARARREALKERCNAFDAYQFSDVNSSRQ